MLEDNIRLHKYIVGTKVEGPGNRLVIWTQGCSMHCSGCFETGTWDYSAGSIIKISDLVSECQGKNISGITVLGGEPFDQPSALNQLLGRCKDINWNTIVFTGYDYEDLLGSEDYNILDALKNIDVLIDGKFDKDDLDYERPFVGSKNQRFIYLTDNIDQTDLESYQKHQVEIRIQKDGVVSMNGFWNVRKKGL